MKDQNLPSVVQNSGAGETLKKKPNAAMRYNYDEHENEQIA